MGAATNGCHGDTERKNRKPRAAVCNVASENKENQKRMTTATWQAMDSTTQGALTAKRTKRQTYKVRNIKSSMQAE
ncbi:hypothetical protein R1flu_013394 [Riccia fluitans]|uniref:Uncharacterized protein n=1 Tax=Riccia fluitans TaxID=41844 RepID=A0ABD1YD97_9MARC